MPIGIFGIAFTIDLFDNLVTPLVNEAQSIDPDYPETSYWIFDNSQIISGDETTSTFAPDSNAIELTNEMFVYITDNVVTQPEDQILSYNVTTDAGDEL
jgi:hypothetical protein